MRILLVGLNYAPEVVGIGPFSTELAEHLAASGHQVSVLTSFPYYPHWRIDPSYEHKGPFSVEKINGVRVIRSCLILPGVTQTAFRRILFDSSLAVTTLMASTAIGAVDTVICISPPLQLGVTAWLIAWPRSARLLLHLQDLVPDAALSVGMMREGIATMTARRLEHFVYARADHITVISQGFLDNLVGKGVPNEKLQLLPNWVNTARYKVEPAPSIRAALGAANGETLVLHTGNMGGKQGLETVLDAAAQLTNENIVMTLVGDGSSRLELVSRAARLGLHNIRFAPLQPDFPATLAAADVLLLAQRGKVVDSVAPSKLLSYMASGKPIVGSVNELSEAGRLIRRAECGVVVPPESPSALADALRELHRRPESHAKFGQAGRRHVAAYYERSDVLERWRTMLEGLCSTSK